MTLIYPVPKTTLNNRNLFGANPDMYKQFGLQGHNGLDFSVTVGTSVKAVADGIVNYVGNDPDGYGYYIRINHDGFQTIYAHGYQAVGFEMGAKIKQEDVIMLSGSSGYSTGPHLHFGIRELDAEEKVLSYDNGYKGYIDPLLPLDGAMIFSGLKLDPWMQDAVDFWVDKGLISNPEKVTPEFAKVLEFERKLYLSNL